MTTAPGPDAIALSTREAEDTALSSAQSKLLRTEVMMKELIQKLEREAKQLKADAEKRQQAIQALQDVCEHDFVPDDHDFLRCKICGLWVEG